MDKNDFDSPCKGVCSGWQQGYDKGEQDILLRARCKAARTVAEMAEFFRISVVDFCDIQFQRKTWDEVIEKRERNTDG